MEFLVSFFLLVVLLVIVLFIVFKRRKERRDVANPPNKRRCLICSYEGSMKTWLRNYNFPQFLMIVLLFLAVIPGVVFIGWSWGKFKCPKCGALAKSVSIAPS